MVHFVSRSLLASYFVADGLAALANPEPLVEDAEPLVLKATEYANQFLPVSVSTRIPTSTATTVRLHGLIQAIGGLMMATGILRRLGAMIVVAAFVPKVIMARPTRQSEEEPNPSGEDTPEEQAEDRLAFLRLIALLGAGLIAAQDTQDKPSRAWLSAHKKLAAPETPAGSKQAKKAAQRHTEVLREALTQA